MRRTTIEPDPPTGMYETGKQAQKHASHANTVSFSSLHITPPFNCVAGGSNENATSGPYETTLEALGRQYFVTL